MLQALVVDRFLSLALLGCLVYMQTTLSHRDVAGQTRVWGFHRPRSVLNTLRVCDGRKLVNEKQTPCVCGVLMSDAAKQCLKCTYLGRIVLNECCVLLSTPSHPWEIDIQERTRHQPALWGWELCFLDFGALLLVQCLKGNMISWTRTCTKKGRGGTANLNWRKRELTQRGRQEKPQPTFAKTGAATRGEEQTEERDQTKKG